MLPPEQQRTRGKRKRNSPAVVIGGGAADSHQPALLQDWFARPRTPLPEYAAAAACICVRSELMAQSKSGTIRSQLLQQPQPPQFDHLARQAILKVWPELVQASGGAEMVYVQLEDFEAEGFPYKAAVKVHRDMSKRCQLADALSRALHLLTRSESDCGLRTVFGLLLHAAPKCEAAKFQALQMIFRRCTPHLPPALPSEEAEASRTGRRRILAATEDFLDEEKEKAFTTYLAQPTEMCLEAMGHDSLDVDVHGANTHLAVLASTLAVRLPREPDLEDNSKGLAPFLHCGLADGALEALQRAENFGKRWTAVPECREPFPGRRPRLWDTNVWLRRGGFAVDSACEAVSSSESASPIRARARAYLERFTGAFAADRVLPRLLRYLTSDEVDRGQDLNGELQDLLTGAQDGTFHGPPLGPVRPEEAASAQHFLWRGADTTCPQFDVARAIVLFQFMGIVKPSDEMIDLDELCQHGTSASSSASNPGALQEVRDGGQVRKRRREVPQEVEPTPRPKAARRCSRRHEVAPSKNMPFRLFLQELGAAYGQYIQYFEENGVERVGDLLDGIPMQEIEQILEAVIGNARHRQEIMGKLHTFL